MITELF